MQSVSRLLLIVAAAALVALSLTPVPASAAEQLSDDALALAYFRSLAESGLADAQLVLGDIYRDGVQAPQDLLEAYAWYYVAAHQGIEEALQPLNEVLHQIPETRWAAAKQRAEDYTRRYIPVAQ